MHMEEARERMYMWVRGWKTWAKDTYGVTSQLLLGFLLSHVILCNLHCIMAILCKLVQH